MSQVQSSGASTTTGMASSASVTKRGNVATLSNKLTAVDTYGNQFNVPDYSIGDILKAIPAHCYERRTFESLYYVFRDIVLLVVSGYLANNYIQYLPNVYLRFGAWAVYTIFQGLASTGLWVLAHECGHSAFSDSTLVNDAVGWVLHSYLMVPYFSWKYSHSMHHKSTGHLTRDMVFVPKTKEQFVEARGGMDIDDIIGDSPVYSLWMLFVQQFGGWLAYLSMNTSGQKLENHTGWEKNHFNPNSVLFDTKRAYWYIVLSDIGLLLQSFVLYTWYKNFGGFNLLVNWVIPWVFVNHWLVFITFLQHSDPTMPHYRAEQWNFARGAAATIDRKFGWVGPFLFHDIIETHVLHHYCSRIPFYNAREASAAIQQIMGEHYRFSDENMFVSLWKSARWCQYVDGDNGVLMYRNTNGKGMGTKLK